MNEGEAMSKKMRRFAATFFVALVLTMLLTQAKYIEPATLYMNNRDLFEDSVRQLHSILDNIVEIGDDVPKEEASSLKWSALFTVKIAMLLSINTKRVQNWGIMRI